MPWPTRYGLPGPRDSARFGGLKSPAAPAPPPEGRQTSLVENLEDEFEPFVHHCGILRALVWAFEMDKFVGCAQTTQIVSAGLQQEELRKLPVSLSLGTSRNVFQLLPEG